MNHEETEKLKRKLSALIAEAQDIKAKIGEAEQLKSRFRELMGGYGTIGLIENARLKVRDSRFPVLQAAKNSFCSNRRIVAVDKKWIAVRTDGDGDKEIDRYRISDGCRERTRGDYYKIDVQKALKIWEEWQNGSNCF